MEPLRQSESHPIEHPTQVAAARRAVHRLGERLGFDEETVARAEIVVAELANNILQHATHGQILLSASPSRDGARSDAIQIVAIDKGPGIASIERAQLDGYSTGSTPGLGLGASQRQAQSFGIFSELGKGVVAAASVSPAASLSRGDDTVVLCTALLGESVNGDSWATRTVSGRDLYLLVDGLGHGILANEASSLATQLFLQGLETRPGIGLAELLQQMHGPMHATRGAAIAIVAVDRATRVATCCGIGNISCVLVALDNTTRSMVSHNGTLGHQMRRLQEFQYPFDPGTLLIMHSDGLSTHWKMSQYPRLVHGAPATIAGVLYRDAIRGRDDATILVSRLTGVAHG
ncbi:Anti-sigma regulatory factor (Ser/Thr protein kinase) [Granulicella rosea]|uniref:Anti-sigma regulatory factor (Ser/Thr protein kinase) n=1 Tax=Granulicella rosea TaxID=474952 RepID=A0A239KTX4_9BACT|nr:ATP-binding protein [Granulicella rosea]SNT20959.1 Anti-sigma regulatory factor (Ser/Thr protein kinase) [Granulicella rosea]